jgi:hypothetical protein
LKDLGLYDAMVMHHDDIALKEKAEKALAPGITPLFTCTRGEMTMTAKGSGTADAK